MSRRCCKGYIVTKETDTSAEVLAKNPDCFITECPAGNKFYRRKIDTGEVSEALKECVWNPKAKKYIIVPIEGYQYTYGKNPINAKFRFENAISASGTKP